MSPGLRYWLRARFDGLLAGDQRIFLRVKPPRAASAEALPEPAGDRGLIVLGEGGDVSDWAAAVHRGQGSFPDIVGRVRALHPSSLPD